MVELAEILRVDLIERRISRVSCIAAVGAPFAVDGAGLAANAGPGTAENDNRHDESAQVECRHGVDLL